MSEQIIETYLYETIEGFRSYKKLAERAIEQVSDAEFFAAEDLTKTVQIRGEDFTVIKAINRAALHTASHVGQVQFLAKHLRSSDWVNLSVPKNQSAEFTYWLKPKEDKGNYLEASRDFAESFEK